MFATFSSKIRAAGYWMSTGVIALAFGMGGLAYLAGSEMQLKGMAELGYPAYFVTILGVCKVLGAVAIVAPGFARLKEWAYAGIAFDLIAAAASHAAVGHSNGKIIAPLVVLAIAAVSWRLADGRELRRQLERQRARREEVFTLDVQTARS
jgi:hypothetical protein